MDSSTTCVYDMTSLLLNKLGLRTADKGQLSNYRPIANLSLVSKIIDRVVRCRLTDFLVTNSLINPHQSAYCKHHSTETAILYIHDHLINAIGSQKLSCLCLLLIVFLPLSIPLTITFYISALLTYPSTDCNRFPPANTCLSCWFGIRCC